MSSVARGSRGSRVEMPKGKSLDPLERPQTPRLPDPRYPWARDLDRRGVLDGLNYLRMARKRMDARAAAPE